MEIGTFEKGGFGVITANPSTDYSLPGGFFNTLRCSVTNYGAPRINVLFHLHARYIEAIFDGKSARGGKVLSEKDLDAPIGRLESGKENLFDFYITNRMNNFVEVDLPNEATTQSLGSDETKTIKVAWPKAYTRIVFNPVSLDIQ